MTGHSIIEELWEGEHLHPDVLLARMDGEPIADAALSHLASCDRCRIAVDSFAGTAERIRDVAQPPLMALDELTAHAIAVGNGYSRVVGVHSPTVVSKLSAQRFVRSRRLMTAMGSVAALLALGLGVGAVVRANRPVVTSDQFARRDTSPDDAATDTRAALIQEEPEAQSSGSALNDAPLPDAGVPTPAPVPAAEADSQPPVVTQPAKLPPATSPPATSPPATSPPATVVSGASPKASADAALTRSAPTVPGPAPAKKSVASKVATPRARAALPSFPAGPSPAGGAAAIPEASSVASAARGQDDPASVAAAAAVAPLPSLGAAPTLEDLRASLVADPTLTGALAAEGPCLSEFRTSLGSLSLRFASAVIGGRPMVVAVEATDVGSTSAPLPRLAAAEVGSCTITVPGDQTTRTAPGPTTTR